MIIISLDLFEVGSRKYSRSGLKPFFFLHNLSLYSTSRSLHLELKAPTELWDRISGSSNMAQRKWPSYADWLVERSVYSLFCGLAHLGSASLCSVQQPACAMRRTVCRLRAITAAVTYVTQPISWKPRKSSGVLGYAPRLKRMWPLPSGKKYLISLDRSHYYTNDPRFSEQARTEKKNQPFQNSNCCAEETKPAWSEALCYFVPCRPVQFYCLFPVEVAGW